MERTALQPRKNKGFFDAELFANEGLSGATGVAYTIFSDSTVAIEQVLTGRAGPGKALARAVIELERPLVERQFSITIR